MDEKAISEKLLIFKEYHKDEIEKIYLEYRNQLIVPVIVIALKNGDKLELEPLNRELESGAFFLEYLEGMYNEYKKTRSKSPDPNAIVEANPAFDPVEHPSHYTEGREYEPKDVIYDWGLDFNLGSAVKYISRAGRKDDIIQDLKKAQQFIQFEIDAIEKKRGKK